MALAGMWFFHEQTSLLNLLSIGTGLAAGFLFVFAKNKSIQQRSYQALQDSDNLDEDAEQGVKSVSWTDSKEQEGARLNDVPAVTSTQIHSLNHLHKNT